MQHSDHIIHKIEEKTIFLLCDLQKIFGNLDPDTFESVQYMIYSALKGIADIINQDNIEGNNKCQNNQIP